MQINLLAASLCQALLIGVRATGNGCGPHMGLPLQWELLHYKFRVM